MLKDLAAVIAGMNGKEVVFEIPDAVEAARYSTATKQGWMAISRKKSDGNRSMI